MEAIFLVIHLLFALGIIGVVLLQRSEGGALGIGGGGGGGGGGLGGLVGGRAAGSFLTKLTGILAAAFFGTSIVLSILAGSGDNGPRSIVIDGPAATGGAAPAGAMGGDHPDAPAAEEPSGPSVPLDE